MGMVDVGGEEGFFTISAGDTGLLRLDGLDLHEGGLP